MEKLQDLKNKVWEGQLKPGWKELNSRRFARKYATKTRDMINESSKAVGQEAAETEKMAQTFFRLLSDKLNLDERKDAPTPEEVKEAIEQLKDVGRLGIFVTLVILPGGVVSLLGLEILAKRFGIRGFNLIPSSFRKNKKSNLPAVPED